MWERAMCPGAEDGAGTRKLAHSRRMGRSTAAQPGLHVDEGTTVIIIISPHFIVRPYIRSP
jgi:hypothetical protein